MMRTLEHTDNQENKLTHHQVVTIGALLDGNWHDREYVREELGLKTLSRSIISERILKPLEKMHLIEQKEMLPKNATEGKRKRKFVRIGKDIDEHRLHMLIFTSANDAFCKYRGRADKMRDCKILLNLSDRSRAICVKLEKQEEERKRKSNEEYWRQKESIYLGSESGSKLIAAAKKIEGIFENRLKPLEGMPHSPWSVTMNEILKGLPDIAYHAAIEAYPDLSKKALQEVRSAELSEEELKEVMANSEALAKMRYPEYPTFPLPNGDNPK